MNVAVALTPAGASGISRRTSAVVIDVLRATSTLTVARQHGARAIVAAATPEDARTHARHHPGALLCGEREGRMIEGFDLGNSPFEYGFDVVSGRTLVFASTNGSQALIAARHARRTLLGAFVSASAVVAALAGERRVVIVCAGKLGAFALEDAACAGWLCARLSDQGATMEGEPARFVRSIAPADAAEVREAVESAEHARYLRTLGPEYARDVEFCATLDAVGQAFEA